MLLVWFEGRVVSLWQLGYSLWGQPYCHWEDTHWVRCTDADTEYWACHLECMLNLDAFIVFFIILIIFPLTTWVLFEFIFSFYAKTNSSRSWWIFLLETLRQIDLDCRLKPVKQKLFLPTATFSFGEFIWVFSRDGEICKQKNKRWKLWSDILI